MIEVKGTSPGVRSARVVKVDVKPGGRVDLWICPPGTPPDSDLGWAIADVSISELLAALGETTSPATSADPSTACLCCREGVPLTRPRICPECRHQFKGNGWDGIDAHWRAKHEKALLYEEFWNSLCPEHRA